MHFMTESANTREARREATAHRISVCAQVLAEERGLDGFTMNDLAEAAGVSRRTLFNYFEGKDAAVLGPRPDLDPALLEEFAAGRPTGNLVDDLSVVLERILEVEDFDRTDLARVQRLIAREPRLMALAKANFDEHGREFLELIRRREGEAYDDLRARVVIAAIGSVFDVVLADFTTQDDTDLAHLYAEALAVLRDVLAR